MSLVETILNTIITLGFLLTLFLSVGSSYLSLLSEAIGRQLRNEAYGKVGRIYTRLGLINSILSLSFFIILVALNAFAPAAISLAFSTRFFASPLTIIFVAMSLQCILTVTHHRRWAGSAIKTLPHLFLGAAASVSSTLAVLILMLITSYMITPDMPTGLLAILRPERFDSLRLLSIMYNSGWLPAALKALFVGPLSAALLVASVSVLILRKTGEGSLQQEWTFNLRWSYRLAFLFGASIILIGFWNAATFHSSIPTIAISLMGVIKEGVPPTTAALVGDLGYLWHLGVVAIVVLAAFATVFYWSSKKKVVQTTDTSALKILIRVAVVFWVIDVITTSATALILPRHSMLIIYVIIGGLAVLESLWLYSQGRIEPKVPVTIFALACVFILMYIGQYNQWFLAYRYGGVPWPPIAFAISLPVAAALSRFSSVQKHVLPLISGFLAPLIIVCKGLLHELLRGGSVVVVDPTYRPILAEWSRVTGIDIAPVSIEYATLTTPQILVSVTAAYMMFVGIFIYLRSSVKIAPSVQLTVTPQLGAKSKMRLSRRALIHLLTSVSCISALATLIPYGSFLAQGPPPAIVRTKIANVSDMPPNSSKIFLWPTEVRPFDTNVLIRDETGNFYAYNRVCTHLQCLLNYDTKTKQILCPCHGSRYRSDTGSVVIGPASNALPVIEIEVDVKGDIYAVGIQGRFGYGR